VGRASTVGEGRHCDSLGLHGRMGVSIQCSLSCPANQGCPKPPPTMIKLAGCLLGRATAITKERGGPQHRHLPDQTCPTGHLPAWMGNVPHHCKPPFHCGGCGAFAGVAASSPTDSGPSAPQSTGGIQSLRRVVPPVACRAVGCGHPPAVSGLKSFGWQRPGSSLEPSPLPQAEKSRTQKDRHNQ
jgi:hypothetical protein